MTTEPESRPDRPSGHEARDAARGSYEDAPVPMCQLGWPGLELVAANGAFRTWTGQHDPIGRRIDDLVPGLRGQPLLAGIERVGSTGRATPAREWRLRTAGETGEPVDHVLDVALDPVHDGDLVVGVRCVIEDVTDEVRRRARARASARRTRARLSEALAVVTTLQDALLPDGLPVLPTVDLAASYRLAEADLGAGGDWFDAVAAPDGRVALVVGDVVGHGVGASAVMGQLRAVLAATLAGGAGPTEALTFLEASSGSIRGARSATVVVVVLDPVSGHLDYCTAGHPPPLVVAPDGRGRFLAPSGGSPLRTGSSFPSARAVVEPGDLVVLYSDGLVERPGRVPAEAMVEIGQVAAEAAVGHDPATDAASAAEHVASRTVDLLTRATGAVDDVTVLAAHRLPDARPVLHVDVAAVPDAVRSVREDLAEWFDRLGLAEPDRIGLQHAVGEVVTNVVAHAYPAAGHGRLVVDGRLRTDGVLELSVADHGAWGAGADGGGRGLAMSRRMVDELEVVRSAEGTTVTVRHRPLRPAGIGVPDPAEAAPATSALTVDRTADGIVLRGPVDLLATPRLRTTLEEATLGGTRPVRVDLAAVTLLGSGGVQVLHDVGVEHLHLVAPPGSVAQHVLELVRLPYVTTP